MALIPSQHLAQQAERHLATANHCLARQLHVLSRLGALGAELSLAESIFEVMLHNHKLLTEHKQLMERVLNKDTKSGKTKSDTKPLSFEPNQEATLLLSQRKLRTS